MATETNTETPTTEKKRTRRPNGDGYVGQRTDGRQELKMSLPGGKRKSLYGQTQAEVVRKRNKVLTEMSDGLPVVNGRTTLDAYLKEWLPIKGPTMKESSWHRYELAIRNHISPVLGRVRLASPLSSRHIQKLHAALLEKGLAPATIGNVHDVLNAALNDAEKWGDIARNPVRLVKPPRVPRYETNPLTNEEAKRLIELAADEPFGALFILLVASGVRRGEAFACKWSAVDLDRAELSVKAGLTRTREGYKVKEAKSEGGHRTVALSDAAVEALRRHKVQQYEMQLRCPDWQGEGFVFCDEVGRRLNPDGRYYRVWKALREKVGVSGKPHSLRHTYATLQRQQGTDLGLLSEQLGHSSIAITDKYYGHVTPKMRDQARQAMNRALGD